jgi:hypothetical protein
MARELEEQLSQNARRHLTMRDSSLYSAACMVIRKIAPHARAGSNAERAFSATLAKMYIISVLHLKRTNS